MKMSPGLVRDLLIGLEDVALPPPREPKAQLELPPPRANPDDVLLEVQTAKS